MGAAPDSRAAGRPASTLVGLRAESLTRVRRLPRGGHPHARTTTERSLLVHPLARSATLIAASLGLATAAARPALAQRLSLSPQIGFYIPTENLYELASGSSVNQLEAGPSFGARLGVWFGNRLGIEASGAYVPTTFKLSQGSQEIASEDAKLFNGSG